MLLQLNGGGGASHAVEPTTGCLLLCRAPPDVWKQHGTSIRSPRPGRGMPSDVSGTGPLRRHMTPIPPAPAPVCRLHPILPRLSIFRRIALQTAPPSLLCTNPEEYRLLSPSACRVLALVPFVLLHCRSPYARINGSPSLFSMSMVQALGPGLCLVWRTPYPGASGGSEAKTPFVSLQSASRFGPFRELIFLRAFFSDGGGWVGRGGGGVARGPNAHPALPPGVTKRKPDSGTVVSASRVAVQWGRWQVSFRV